jgi:hypothetical protein
MSVIGQEGSMNHRFVTILLTIFVIIHDPTGDRAASYDGMNQATVTSLIQQTGFTFDFVDSATYAAFILAHQPVPLTPAQILAAVRAQASTSITGGAESVSELQRAVLLTILDQLNTIRAALPTPLSAITPAQAKTAVQAKINSGAAD